MCHALVYSFVCRVCVAAQGSLAKYADLQYAAAGCTYAAVPNEIAWCVALTYATVGWAWAAALDGIAQYIALPRPALALALYVA